MLLWAIVGIVLIGVVLLDAFETVVLPRRVAHGAWLARLVIWASWHLWSCPARDPWRRGERRETSLSFYGPPALLLLIGGWGTGVVGGHAPARPRARPNYSGAMRAWTCPEPWRRCSWRGSAGRPSCWRVICRTRSWPSIAPSTPSNRGSPGSP